VVDPAIVGRDVVRVEEEAFLYYSVSVWQAFAFI
jgi:hypothetical protein